MKASYNIGERFGNLVIIDIDKNKSGYVICKCDCGNTKSIKHYSLKSGKTKSCGHNTTGFKNLKDQQFGELKAIEYIGNSKWKCKCSCGNEHIVHRKYLLSGEIKSCGHYKNEKILKTRENIIGKKFGHLTVLEYTGDKKYKCQCDCKDKTIKYILKHNLISGSTYSCGCIGNGRALSKEDILDEINKFTINNNRKPNLLELETMFSLRWAQIREYIKRYNMYEYIDNKYGSTYEIEIANLLKEYMLHDRTVIDNGELDFYLPNKKIAIEFNGDYWHSEIYKDKYYHQNKTIACAKKGIQLIHIFEYEWNNEQTKEKLKKLLDNKINLNYIKLYARKCNIDIIDKQKSKEFCEKYHLQNYVNSDINIGCFFKNELVGVITFGKPRFNKEYQYELLRLCWKPDICVCGGLQKMFKFFIRKYNPSSIITYSNISKFNGNGYLKIGFKPCKKSITEPSYVWVNAYNKDVKTRYQTQKHKLLEKQLGTNDMTEVEIMESLNYYRVYDCGNIALEWINKNKQNEV